MRKKTNWRMKRLLEALEKPNSYDAAKIKRQKLEMTNPDPEEEFKRI